MFFLCFMFFCDPKLKHILTYQKNHKQTVGVESLSVTVVLCDIQLNYIYLRSYNCNEIIEIKRQPLIQVLFFLLLLLSCHRSLNHRRHPHRRHPLVARFKHQADDATPTSARLQLQTPALIFDARISMAPGPCSSPFSLAES